MVAKEGLIMNKNRKHFSVTQGVSRSFRALVQNPVKKTKCILYDTTGFKNSVLHVHIPRLSVPFTVSYWVRVLDVLVKFIPKYFIFFGATVSGIF